MKKSRKLFVLSGSERDVNIVIEELSCRYKALISANFCTENDICAIFNINKSIVCAQENFSILPNKFLKDAICIKIINNWSINKNDLTQDFINIDAESIPCQFKMIADKYNCDLGDETEDVFALTGNKIIKNCNLCAPCSSSDNGKNINRVIYMNDNFFVMPTLGGFLKGDLLIIPKRHVFSIASLPKDFRSDFLKVLSDTKYILNLTYKVSDFLIWENGSNMHSKNIAKDSITHANVHIVPTSKVTAKIIKEKYNVPLSPISFDQLTNYSNASYLLLKSDDGWEICSDPRFYIPRQFVRQVLAERYNIPGDQWNWRIHPLIDSLNRTTDQITSALKANWSKLPNHIRENCRMFL